MQCSFSRNEMLGPGDRPARVAGSVKSRMVLELVLPLASHWDSVTSGTGAGYSFNLDYPPQHGPQLDVLLSIGARWHS
jgi:hypothetical protein